jgi:hypothetical protein
MEEPRMFSNLINQIFRKRLRLRYAKADVLTALDYHTWKTAGEIGIEIARASEKRSDEKAYLNPNMLVMYQFLDELVELGYVERRPLPTKRLQWRLTSAGFEYRASLPEQNAKDMRERGFGSKLPGYRAE